MSETVQPWIVEQLNPVVTNIIIPYEQKKKWEFWALLTSDRHLDNPHSNRTMQKRHLDLAKERRAAVIDIGDLFCAMQGRDDRRGSKEDVHEENQRKNYLGSLTKTAKEFFAPYKENIAVLGQGNHESSVLDKKEYDLTTELVDRLKDLGSQAVRGGYRGWVRFKFNGPYRKCNTINLYYNHGAGGGGPVTRGVIQTNRRAVYLPDADIVVTGHIHESWQVEIPRVSLTVDGNEVAADQTHICIPTYKEEFFGTAEGFHHEKERAPKPLGAWWLRFFNDYEKGKVCFEVARAK